MTIVTMLEAKSNLSRLVESLEREAEDEIIITRNSKPAARLAPIAKTAPATKRIGVAKGPFEAPAPDPALDAEIAQLFRSMSPPDAP